MTAKKVLITGSAGFIGSALAIRLLDRGDTVIGIDNHNDYYDPQLKEDRLARHLNHPAYTHIRGDIADAALLGQLFQDHAPTHVINLAAQAGVRYSIENPAAYAQSNLVGFTNLLEACRHHQVEHLSYASSSSVYGANAQMPFSTHHSADHPYSFYAATKRANELMAHSYAHLYGLPCTGLRFFTVYGPWGRPDMALYKFTRAILANEKIPVYNYGKHRRDFTYIDDVVEGVIRVNDNPATINSDWDSHAPDIATSSAPWKLYNIGNSQPVDLLDYISAIEEALGMTADKDLLPMQPGDVPDTYSDVSDLQRDLGYRPDTRVAQGVNNFVQWYRGYYQV
jgi:UDP-glucuronate 4-epimerase